MPEYKAEDTIRWNRQTDRKRRQGELDPLHLRELKTQRWICFTTVFIGNEQTQKWMVTCGDTSERISGCVKRKNRLSDRNRNGNERGMTVRAKRVFKRLVTVGLAQNGFWKWYPM